MSSQQVLVAADQLRRTLIAAVASNDVATTMECIEAGGDPNMLCARGDVDPRIRKGSSIISLGCYFGSSDVVAFLATIGGNMEHIDEHEMTPFLVASECGYVSVIKLLVERNCNREARNKENNGALALACVNGHLHAVVFLVDVVRLAVNDKHQCECNSLHLSAQKGHTRVCEFLLQREAEIESLNQHDSTPFLTAANFGHVDVLRLLQQWRCNTLARNKYNNGALALACYNGHLNEVKFLVDVLDLAVNDRHQFGFTPLRMAVTRGHTDVREFLLRREAEIGSLKESRRSAVSSLVKPTGVQPVPRPQQPPQQPPHHPSHSRERPGPRQEHPPANQRPLVQPMADQSIPFPGAAGMQFHPQHFVVPHPTEYAQQPFPYAQQPIYVHATPTSPFSPQHQIQAETHVQTLVSLPGTFQQQPRHQMLLQQVQSAPRPTGPKRTPIVIRDPETNEDVTMAVLSGSWKGTTTEESQTVASVMRQKIAAALAEDRAVTEDKVNERTREKETVSDERRELEDTDVSLAGGQSERAITTPFVIEEAVEHSPNKEMEHSEHFEEGVLDTLGPEGRQHFLEAIGKGKMKIARVNLDMVGDGEAGKSSLGDSLMDEPFIEERESTKGANVIYMIQTATGYITNWKKDENRSRSLGHLLARGSVLAQDAVDRQSNAQSQPLSNTEDDKEDSTTPSDLESSSLRSIDEESIQASPEDDRQVVIFGHKEFQSARDLTEERAKAIKLLQNDPDELQKQMNLVHISVCDRGGQEHFLPIHTALIANCSEFIPKAYLLVFDLTKRLGDFATATFRAERGGRKLTYSRCRQMKNEEIISRWASAVDLAHPECEVKPGKSKQPQRKLRPPYLGQHKVRRGPAMFIIGTHYDEIIKKGEEGKAIVIDQEVAVRKIMSKHKYVERVVLVDDKKNELIFKVDNTRSGTGSPDAMVIALRKLIFEMAITYRDDIEETPLPYVVLELGLLNLSQPEEPGSDCDSDRKIVCMNDVVHLAQRYCDIEGQGPCRTALRYLSSVGVIFYFFKAAGLTDKVFTDPQWLFDVMSTFVTVLDNDNFSPHYLYDLKQLKEEGRMSQQLAEHLLERREKLGVKPKHYNTIFRLLQLVDVFCPAQSQQSSPTLVVDDAEDFYVPCMLEIDYNEKTAWQQSGLAGDVSERNGSARHPPSLIFKPDNVDSFPESLFFRLSSRTAYQFPEFPQLKRNRIQVHFGDSDLELELLYHHTSRYVIATVFPSNEEEPPAPEVVNRQCTRIRRFLRWQLNDAKRNGLDGFQYKMYFQVEKKSDTIDIDEELLCPLADCDEMPKMIINPKSRSRLKKKDYLSIKLWYSCKPSECGENVVPTESELVLVAQTAQRQWIELAGAMKPRPFYRNEIIKFEDETDNSEFGKTLRMLQEWQREHGDQATTSNLNRSLAAADVTYVVKEEDPSSSLKAGPLNHPEQEVRVLERSSPDHPYRSDLLYSPQVATGSGTAAEAEKKLTAGQGVEIAERVAGEWEKLVVYLSPEFFRPVKISEIKKLCGTPFLQAQTALAMWSDQFNEKASQGLVIKALCRIGYRAQAVEVFKNALVDFVAPH